MRKEKNSSRLYKDQKIDKIYVIDTNVIINDPDFVTKLKGKILIPKTVLEELDKHKFGHSEKAKNIRDFSRYLDKNSDQIWFYDSDLYEGSNDTKIIKTAKRLQAQKHDVTLVTNDILMGLMAKAAGLNIQKHDLNCNGKTINIYSGIQYATKTTVQEHIEKSKGFLPNKYVLGSDGLYIWKQRDIIKRLNKDRKIWSITHKNLEQKCAIDALMDDKIKLVTISGKAGTGKTMVSIAAGLEKVINEGKYDKLIVSRPIVPMGHDIGFLPGTVEEKLSPWMQPIFDNIDFLFSSKDIKHKNSWEKMVADGLLKLEALTYIRGRSIPNQFMLIDEAQNLSKHELKTIITRAGYGTKIVLTGDIYQIDNPKLDAINNGFTYAIEKFKRQEIAAHINLTNCERSELANIAADIL